MQRGHPRETCYLFRYIAESLIAVGAGSTERSMPLTLMGEEVFVIDS